MIHRSVMDNFQWITNIVIKNSHERNLSYGITTITAAEIVNKSLPVVSIAADVPLIFPTVQLYMPKMLVTLWAMVSTV